MIPDYPDYIICDDGNAQVYWLIWAQNPTGPNTDTDVFYWGGVNALSSALPISYSDLTASVFSCEEANIPTGGGTATSSPYMVDVGSTVMLGGILMFLIAHWFIGLVRNRTKN